MYSGRKSSVAVSRDAKTSSFSSAAAERVRNGSRGTPNILFGGEEEIVPSETSAPRARNAFERHVAALKLAAAYRGRIGRKKADTERRKADTVNRQAEAEVVEANRPKQSSILRPKGKSYIGF
jgi:hypothetical protein